MKIALFDYGKHYKKGDAGEWMNLAYSHDFKNDTGLSLVQIEKAARIMVDGFYLEPQSNFLGKLSVVGSRASDGRFLLAIVQARRENEYALPPSGRPFFQRRYLVVQQDDFRKEFSQGDMPLLALYRAGPEQDQLLKTYLDVAGVINAPVYKPIQGGADNCLLMNASKTFRTDRQVFALAEYIIRATLEKREQIRLIVGDISNEEKLKIVDAVQRLVYNKIGWLRFALHYVTSTIPSETTLIFVENDAVDRTFTDPYGGLIRLNWDELSWEKLLDKTLQPIWDLNGKSFADVMTQLFLKLSDENNTSSIQVELAQIISERDFSKFLRQDSKAQKLILQNISNPLEWLVSYAEDMPLWQWINLLLLLDECTNLERVHALQNVLLNRENRTPLTVKPVIEMLEKLIKKLSKMANFTENDWFYLGLMVCSESQNDFDQWLVINTEHFKSRYQKNSDGIDNLFYIPTRNLNNDWIDVVLDEMKGIGVVINKRLEIQLRNALQNYHEKSSPSLVKEYIDNPNDIFDIFSDVDRRGNDNDTAEKSTKEDKQQPRFSDDEIYQILQSKNPDRALDLLFGKNDINPVSYQIPSGCHPAFAFLVSSANYYTEGEVPVTFRRIILKSILMLYPIVSKKKRTPSSVFSNRLKDFLLVALVIAIVSVIIFYFPQIRITISSALPASTQTNTPTLSPTNTLTPTIRPVESITPTTNPISINFQEKDLSPAGSLVLYSPEIKDADKDPVYPINLTSADQNKRISSLPEEINGTKVKSCIEADAAKTIFFDKSKSVGDPLVLIVAYHCAALEYKIAKIYLNNGSYEFQPNGGDVLNAAADIKNTFGVPIAITLPQIMPNLYPKVGLAVSFIAGRNDEEKFFWMIHNFSDVKLLFSFRFRENNIIVENYKEDEIKSHLTPSDDSLRIVNYSWIGTDVLFLLESREKSYFWAVIPSTFRDDLLGLDIEQIKIFPQNRQILNFTLSKSHLAYLYTENAQQFLQLCDLALNNQTFIQCKMPSILVSNIFDAIYDIALLPDGQKLALAAHPFIADQTPENPGPNSCLQGCLFTLSITESQFEFNRVKNTDGIRQFDWIDPSISN